MKFCIVSDCHGRARLESGKTWLVANPDFVWGIVAPNAKGVIP